MRALHVFVNTLPYGFAVANVRTPRKAWIDVALTRLGKGGPDAVRIETMASSLGVTKGSFYWHFADRQALLDALLAQWQIANTEELIAQVDRSQGEPRERLRQLFELSQHIVLTDVEIAIREWARRDPRVAERLVLVDNRRMAYLRTLFKPICKNDVDVEDRCMLAFALVIGTYFVAAQHGSRSRSEVIRSASMRLLGETLA